MPLTVGIPKETAPWRASRGDGARRGGSFEEEGDRGGRGAGGPVSRPIMRMKRIPKQGARIGNRARCVSVQMSF